MICLIRFGAGHPDFPFPEAMYRTNHAGKSRIISGHAGHKPLWTHAFGFSQGKYGSQVYTDFSTTTRKVSKSLRVPYKPQDVMAMRDPSQPPPRSPLYPEERFYIPGTTCYSPAIRERYGHGFSQLTLDSFERPVPKIADPLAKRDDSKEIDQLSLISGYAGFRPREFRQMTQTVHNLTQGTEMRITGSLR